MLGEYVENRILGMDKGGGGYHFFIILYSKFNLIFHSNYLIRQQYIGLRTVRRQFRNEVWNMFEVRKFGNPRGRPTLTLRYSFSNFFHLLDRLANHVPTYTTQYLEKVGILRYNLLEFLCQLYDCTYNTHWEKIQEKCNFSTQLFVSKARTLNRASIFQWA